MNPNDIGLLTIYVGEDESDKNKIECNDCGGNFLIKFKIVITSPSDYIGDSTPLVST